MDNNENGTMYLVMAYRLGQVNGYHFPVGVFHDFTTAQAAADFHHSYRGAKYDHKIWYLTPDAEYDAEEAELIRDLAGPADA